MNDQLTSGILIERKRLHAAAEVIGARFDAPESEAERLVRARDFLTAAFALERALKTHTRCTLVNHCGSLGAHNLKDVTEMLLDALVRYAATIRGLSSPARENPSPVVRLVVEAGRPGMAAERAFQR